MADFGGKIKNDYLYSHELGLLKQIVTHYISGETDPEMLRFGYKGFMEVC